MLKNKLLLIPTLIITVFLSTSTFIPIVDIPQFAGQLHLLKNFIHGSTQWPWYSNIEINYFLPYWSVNLLALPLSYILPINYAANTTLGIIFFFFIYFYSKLREEFNAPKVLDWVLLPSFFGLPYIWGFITFLFAVSLSGLLILIFVKYINKPSIKLALTIIIVGIFVFLAHFLCFLFVGLVLGGLALFKTQYQSIKNLFIKFIPLFIFASFIPLFFINTGFFGDNSISNLIVETSASHISHNFDLKTNNLLTQNWVYNTLTATEDSYYIALSIALYFLPIIMGLSPSKHFWKYIPIFCFLIIWFSLPYYYAKTFFIYSRFIIFFFPFYILIFEIKTTSRLNKLSNNLFILISCIMITPPIIDVYYFNKKESYFIDVINTLPPNQKILHLNFSDFTTPDNSMRLSRAFLHFPVWYQSMRDGWVDMNFAWFPSQLIRYKSAKHASEIKPSMITPLQQLSSISHCNSYDYLLVRIQNEREYVQFSQILNRSTCSHTYFNSYKQWYIFH